MSPTKEFVIPKEKAVFRLDGQGRWHNAQGPLQHPKIINHFHRSIRRDAGGYHLFQDHGTHVEKVYFPYADTALFVWDLSAGQVIELRLNTGRRIPLDPQGMVLKGEALYYDDNGEWIKFTDRALLKLAPCLDESGEGLSLTLGNRSYPIRQAD